MLAGAELEDSLKGWVNEAAFSPAGDLVAAASTESILVWPVSGGKPLTRMRFPDTESHTVRLAFTPDGKSIVSARNLDPKLRYWDVKSGKQIREIDHPAPATRKGDSGRFVAFAPGAALAAVYIDGREGGINLVDLASGKVQAEIRGADYSYGSWLGVDFSSDGKLFAINGTRESVRVYDTATGKLLKELREANPETIRAGRPGGAIRFSPDGRFLTAPEITGHNGTFNTYQTVVWSVADGKRQVGIPDLTAPPFTADNRALIIGNLNPDRPFLHDLLTGKYTKVKAKIEAKGDVARWIGRSPDGKTLAFAIPSNNAHEQRIHLISLPELPEPLTGTGPPNADALAFLWAGWGSDSEFRREYAWKRFTAHPELAVGFAGDRLYPVSAEESRRVAEMVKRLDDDIADVRDKAVTDLSAQVHAFEPLLKATLDKASPGEVRNRLTIVLRGVKDTPTPDELKVALRGVTLLEKLKSPAAVEHLKRLAKGADGATVTDAAAKSLKRIGG